MSSLYTLSSSVKDWGLDSPQDRGAAPTSPGPTTQANKPRTEWADRDEKKNEVSKTRAFEATLWTRPAFFPDRALAGGLASAKMI